MTCGRVGSWKNRPTFEELAVMFEGSTASGAERAYRKAVDKLTELLVAEGALHAVRLKQKTKTKRKKKIAAAIYEYQADCDGEWGEISVDFENGTAEIIRLADWERAYRKAVDKLTELLVAEDAIHAVRLKQKSKTKRKKKIAAAIYEYQADCAGEWGEISLDFENGTAEIIRLADWDTMKTNRFANKVIAYLLNCENEKLPTKTMLAFEP